MNGYDCGEFFKLYVLITSFGSRLCLLGHGICSWCSKALHLPLIFNIFGIERASKRVIVICPVLLLHARVL